MELFSAASCKKLFGLFVFCFLYQQLSNLEADVYDAPPPSRNKCCAEVPCYFKQWQNCNMGREGTECDAIGTIQQAPTLVAQKPKSLTRESALTIRHVSTLE